MNRAQRRANRIRTIRILPADVPKWNALIDQMVDMEEEAESEGRTQMTEADIEADTRISAEVDAIVRRADPGKTVLLGDLTYRDAAGRPSSIPVCEGLTNRAAR